MVEIRNARIEDAEKLAELVARLKRLNEEFDPLLKVSDELVSQAKEYISEAIKDEKSLVLVAEDGGRVIGVLKADIVDRLFYTPRMEGRIIDLYVMPEYRRKGIGNRLLEHAIAALREHGAELITAEFPCLNKIATSFYEDLDFRPITCIYAREL